MATRATVTCELWMSLGTKYFAHKVDYTYNITARACAQCTLVLMCTDAFQQCSTRTRRHVSEQVIDFRAQKSMLPDDHMLTEHAQMWRKKRGLIILVDIPTNSTQALRADRSKEEEFANIIKVSETYTGIHEHIII